MMGNLTTEKPGIDEIERFYEDRSTNLTERVYYRIGPGTYTYLIDQSDRSLQYLADRFDGSTLFRKCVAKLLRGFSSLPVPLNVLPAFDKCSVQVSPDHPFNVAILGSRTKLLEWNDQTATTLSNGFPELVRKEIEVRRKLPEGIRVPDIVETDVAFPFLLERLINGTPIAGPVEDWPYYRNAYLQLQIAYEYFPSEQIEIERVLTETESALRNDGLYLNPTIRRAFETISQMQLPKTLSRGFVHGDLYKDNVIRSGDKISIIDWADSGFDRYQFGDFAQSFIKQYGYTNNSIGMREVFNNRGVGGEILTEYSNLIGETVWSDSTPFPGAILLYPLIILAEGRYQREFTETIYYSAISDLLNS